MTEPVLIAAPGTTTLGAAPLSVRELLLELFTSVAAAATGTSRVRVWVPQTLLSHLTLTSDSPDRGEIFLVVAGQEFDLSRASERSDMVTFAWRSDFSGVQNLSVRVAPVPLDAAGLELYYRLRLDGMAIERAAEIAAVL